MSTKHNVSFLLFCGFALLTVSANTCNRTLAEGVTCIINLPKPIDPKGEVKWTFTPPNSPDLVAVRKKGMDREKIDGATIETNGALKLQNVDVSKTGKYKYQVFNEQGSEIAAGEQEITIYVKALKPNVEFKCHNGSATLTCNTQMMDKRDLTITWSKGKETIPGADKTTLHQTSKELLENKEYSCTVRNPVSTAHSDSKAVSCEDFLSIFGVEKWLMVSILAGGGALLLLLISVLVICACRSCKQQERQKDEEELRLGHFPAPLPTDQQRSKVTARGQPAPPIPQEDSLHCDPTTQTPPRTQAQPKGQVRARPPPPPQDEDEEDPPPLPRPRKKQHRERRNQEPYLPME